MQIASGLFHFSDQLERQKLINGGVAVFEMFYCEYNFGQQPKFMYPKLSSCVWHDDAEVFRQNRKCPNHEWSQRDLENLLNKDSTNIMNIMTEFGKCNKGSPFSMVDPKMIASELGLPQRILTINADNEVEPEH